METPLVEHTIAALRELFALPAYSQRGRLPSELELAARIGVSRPVLRQALAALKQEGIVESRRGSGTFIRRGKPTAFSYGRPETLGDLVDCLRFRNVIESAAAAEAARRADPTLIDEIRRAVLTLESYPSRDVVVAEADMAFHLAVARATGSRYPAMTLEFLMPHIMLGLQMGRQLHSVPPNVTSRRVAEEHRAILAAIEAGDADLAAERMKDHLSAGIERIFGKRAW